MSAFERAELDNVFRVGEDLEKLRDSHVIERVEIAAVIFSFDLKFGDPGLELFKLGIAISKVFFVHILFLYYFVPTSLTPSKKRTTLLKVKSFRTCCGKM